VQGQQEQPEHSERARVEQPATARIRYVEDERDREYDRRGNREQGSSRG
jgi:hypothetical protein